jgi:hypothetical protein
MIDCQKRLQSELHDERKQMVTKHIYVTVYVTAYLSASSQSVIPYFGKKDTVDGTK